MSYDIAVWMSVGQTVKIQKPIYQLQFFAITEETLLKRSFTGISDTVGAFNIKKSILFATKIVWRWEIMKIIMHSKI